MRVTWWDVIQSYIPVTSRVRARVECEKKFFTSTKTGRIAGKVARVKIFFANAAVVAVVVTKTSIATACIG